MHLLTFTSMFVLGGDLMKCDLPNKISINEHIIAIVGVPKPRG